MLEYNDAKQVRQWRVLLGMSFETIAKKWLDKYVHNPYFARDEYERGYVSPIWGYILCVEAQLRLNESRNHDGWNLPNLNSCNNVDDDGNIVHHNIWKEGGSES